MAPLSPLPEAPRIGVGRGKLLLFGEHAAVHGFPAMGIPLDLETRVELDLRGAAAPCRFPGMAADDVAIVRRIIDRLGAPAGCSELRVRSTVPRGAGFGSSAALCVALAAALIGAEPPYGDEVWRLAHGAERLFHGTPSGIDTGLALLAGMRLFRPRPPELPLDERLPDVDLHLVVGAVPRLASTGELVAGLASRLASGEPAARAGMAELGAVAEEARAAVLSRGAAVGSTLGPLADRAHRALSSLGLSTPALEGILERGRSLGALGGKLSGAGGGGAFFLLAPSPGASRRIADALARHAPGTRPLLWSRGTAAPARDGCGSTADA